MESVFHSQKHRDTFRTQYQRILDPLPFGKRYVETSFGRTFLLTHGDADKPPVMLLHGSCSNSVFWMPEMLALAAHHQVFAVDIIGEAGNSAEYRPDLHTDAFANWLADVMDALQLPRTALIGNSLGGWMALKTATTYPARVSALALIASAGLAPIRPQFLQDVANAQQANQTPTAGADVLGAPVPPEVLAFMNLILASYQPIRDLPVFSDAELARLSMPLLLINGEEDAIIDAKESSARLLRMHAEAEIHLLPNTGHMITNSAALIAPFLAKAHTV